MDIINLIGPGRVGTTLLRCVTRNGGYAVQDVCGPRPERIDAVGQSLGAGQAAAVATARAADIWLLAVPDGEIQSVAAELAERDLRPATAIHFSGFHSAEAMAPLAERGWQLASAHPNLSFADPEMAAENFAGTLVGIEGSADAVTIADRLMTALGARTFALSAESKVLYHAAAVISNNFTTVLQAIAQQVWAEAGLSDAVARELSADLMRAAAENTEALGPAAALTGPAARGDDHVVQAETADLSDWQPQAGQLYAKLSTCAVRLKKTGRPF